MAAATIQIIDTHIHILQPSRFHYHWLESGSAFNRDFELADVRQEMKSSGVVGGVLMEATNTPEEISWLLEVCEISEGYWGVIGWIALEQQDAIKRIAHFAQHPQFKGVRLNWLERRTHTTQLDQTIQAVASHGLVVDVLARWEHLSDILIFMRGHPQVSFVLEHLGGVTLNKAMFAPWQSIMKAFASLPNVTVKISGYAASSTIPLRNYVETAVTLFGSHRLMFGSNYPLCLHAASYSEIVTHLYDITADLGKGLQTALFFETARHIYQLSQKETL